MKIAKFFVAAGLAVAALGVSGGAEARDWNHNGRPDRFDRHDRWHNGPRWNGNRGWYGHDRRWNNHRVRCWTEWRHHHRVRVCR